MLFSTLQPDLNKTLPDKYKLIGQRMGFCCNFRVHGLVAPPHISTGKTASSLMLFSLDRLNSTDHRLLGNSACSRCFNIFSTAWFLGFFLWPKYFWDM